MKESIFHLMPMPFLLVGFHPAGSDYPQNKDIAGMSRGSTRQERVNALERYHKIPTKCSMHHFVDIYHVIGIFIVAHLRLPATVNTGFVA